MRACSKHRGFSACHAGCAEASGSTSPLPAAPAWNGRENGSAEDLRISGALDCLQQGSSVSDLVQAKQEWNSAIAGAHTCLRCCMCSRTRPRSGLVEAGAVEGYTETGGETGCSTSARCKPAALHSPCAAQPPWRSLRPTAACRRDCHRLRPGQRCASAAWAVSASCLRSAALTTRHDAAGC